jgi:hypothetical protein
MQFDIMPWYNFGFATLFCDFRAQMSGTNSNDDEFYWHFNPYLRKDFAGGAQFRIGGYVGTTGHDLGRGGADTVGWGLATVALFAF